MTIVKKFAWFILYLVAFISASFSLVYFSQKDLAAGLIASLISLLIYTFLITRDFKFLSPVSFFTVPAVSLLILGAVGKQTNGFFGSSENEKIFMVTVPLLILFGLANSVFWAQKQRFKKWIGVGGITLSVFMLLVYGTVLPTYYQNFVYTRLSLLILLIFSVFLIFKNKKLLGILSLLITVGALVLSASAFSDKTYALEVKEYEAVLAFTNPKAKEMFEYYNQKDYGNFCKYCGFTLQNMLVKKPISASRDAWGPYTSLDGPISIIRRGGSFYVQYKVQFQKVPNLMYVTFQLENINPDSTIYGLSITDKS